MMRTWTFLCLLFLTSCTGSRPGLLKSDPRPSVLVIAADNLGSDTIDCSREIKPGPQKSGFDILCHEFARWPHAFTTSSLAVPTVASLLTGQYPVQLGLRHNAGTLNASFETAPEVALKNGWSTHFLSGGPPLLRKTGLNQGFESFDDNFKPTLDILYRPFFQSIQIYESTLRELGQQLQLAFFYVPDLLFTKVQTRNSLGEVRNLSFESQVEELDDNLGKLFSVLKQSDRWQKTVVFVVGLSAPGKGLHPKTPSSENLFAEKTQVALFTKGTPAHPLKSSEDNVTLADVGRTISSLVGGGSVTSDGLGLETISLAEISNSQNQTQRLIAIEAASPFWHEHKDIIWAFRAGTALCLGLESPKCFDSLIDREEQFASPKTKTAKLNLPIPFVESLRKISIPSQGPKTLETFPPKNLKASPCFQLIQLSRFSLADLKKCDEVIILDLAQWIREDQNPQSDVLQREQSKKKFIRDLWFHKLDHHAYDMNVSLGLIWDINSERLSQRSVIDEVLELPEIQKYKVQAIRALSIEGDDLVRP